jgi:hypothetical protein
LAQSAGGRGVGNGEGRVEEVCASARSTCYVPHGVNAWKFISWASSKKCEELAGSELGWSRVPAGKRASTYHNGAYLQQASAFAEPTRSAIESADLRNPGTQPRPALGIQFVDIPEFPDLAQADHLGGIPCDPSELDENRGAAR